MEVENNLAVLHSKNVNLHFPDRIANKRANNSQKKWY